MEKTDASPSQDQSAQGRKKFKDVSLAVLAAGVSILVLGLMYAVCLAALATHRSIHNDTKHKHKDNTPPGTQVLKDINGDDLTVSLTTVHFSGDAAICGLLHGNFGADPVDRARSLGGVNDITLAYQGAEAQHLLHLRVGLIRHSVPDDTEDAEAVVGEIYSASGDFNLVLQQGGVVSVKEGGELFATEVVCDVAEVEQRRRLILTLTPDSGAESLLTLTPVLSSTLTPGSAPTLTLPPTSYVGPCPDLEEVCPEY